MEERDNNSFIRLKERVCEEILPATLVIQHPDWQYTLGYHIKKPTLVPKTIKLRLETSLKFQESDWLKWRPDQSGRHFSQSYPRD
jgi:hypothetical protein